MTEENELVSRAEFFSKAFKKSFKVALDLAGSITTPLERISGFTEDWQEIWSGNLVDTQAKFVFYKGQPYYLYKTKDSVFTFSGLCPKDSNLVSIHPNGKFTCTQCNSVFDPTAGDEDYRLQALQTKVDGGKIFIAL